MNGELEKIYRVIAVYFKILFNVCYSDSEKSTGNTKQRADLQASIKDTDVPDKEVCEPLHHRIQQQECSTFCYHV